MNDEAVRILKDAMEPPSWWTNGARLSAREVAARLEEHGYALVRRSDAAAESSAAPATTPALDAPVAVDASAAPAAPGVPLATAAPEPATDQPSPERADKDPLASLMASLEAAVAGVRKSQPRADSEQTADDERKTA